MDKKEINSPKMTLNFLIWVGGVFMLLLFAFLAHFVWRIRDGFERPGYQKRVVVLRHAFCAESLP
jgi:hypothetical protein